jgi:membrane-bound inhibitor of C-type lysozyme
LKQIRKEDICRTREKKSVNEETPKHSIDHYSRDSTEIHCSTKTFHIQRYNWRSVSLQKRSPQLHPFRSYVVLM